jgi:hypothetical protein
VGINSKLLGDYAALLSALGTDYPAARKSALEGSPSTLDAVRAEWAERVKKMNAWLDEAEASEEE